MIELRDAQFLDYAAVSKLHSESWRQNYRGILSDNFLDFEVEKVHSDIWIKRFQSPGKSQQITVATLNHNIVGFSCLLLDDDSFFGSLLDNLHVLTNDQKTGIGKLLMQNCARIIYEKRGNKNMYLWVYELNKNARNFYERLGGTKYETIEKQNIDGTKAQACRYIWNDVSLII